MTTGGWLVMILSISFVTVFFAVSLYLVLRKDSE
jgi:hypothetical protein